MGRAHTRAHTGAYGQTLFNRAHTCAHAQVRTRTRMHAGVYEKSRTRACTDAHTCTHALSNIHAHPPTYTCALACTHAQKQARALAHTHTHARSHCNTRAGDARNKTWHAPPQERTRKDWTAVNGRHSPQKHLTVLRQQRRQRASDWTAPEGHMVDRGQGDKRVESSGGEEHG